MPLSRKAQITNLSSSICPQAARFDKRYESQQCPKCFYSNCYDWSWSSLISKCSPTNENKCWFSCSRGWTRCIHSMNIEDVPQGNPAWICVSAGDVCVCVRAAGALRLCVCNGLLPLHAARDPACAAARWELGLSRHRFVICTRKRKILLMCCIYSKQGY